MPKKLLLINAILIAIAAGSVVFIARQLMAPMPMPQAGKARPPAAAGERPADAGRPSASAYMTVVAKNLFSPTRTEAPVSATASAAANLPKPNLFGIVLREGAPIAYLEDPTTKRVSGYRIGDAVAGGTVQAISADSVSIQRPDGKMDVRLRDPGKPRQAIQSPPALAGTPGAQPVANQPLPGVIPPAAPPQVGPVPAVPPAVPQIVPGQPTTTPPVIPGRRPLPPNLLRRLPQAPPTDAPQR